MSRAASVIEWTTLDISALNSIQVIMPIRNVETSVRKERPVASSNGRSMAISGLDRLVNSEKEREAIRVKGLTPMALDLG